MPPVHWGTLEIVEIPPYTEEEAKKVWYDDDELEKISCDVFDSVRVMTVQQSHDNVKDSDDCSRGLEGMTAQGSLARIVAKLSMDSVVLEEQRRQRERGIKDDEALARAAQTESEKHVHRAATLGLQDQKSADEILNRKRELPKVDLEQNVTIVKQPWFRRRLFPRKDGKDKKYHFKIGFAIRNCMRFNS